MNRYTCVIYALCLLFCNACKEDAVFETLGVVFGESKISYVGNGVKLTATVENYSGEIIEKGFIVRRTFLRSWWEEEKTYEATYKLGAGDPFEILLENDFEPEMTCKFTPYAVIGNYTYAPDAVGFKAPRGSDPVITSVTPGTGSYTDTYTLTGKNFSVIPERNEVYLNYEGGLQCTVLEAKENSLKIKIDAVWSIELGVPYDIAIKVGSKTGKLEKALTVNSNAKVSSMIPASPQVGEYVTLELENLEGYTAEDVIFYQDDTYIYQTKYWGNLTQSGNRLSFTLPSGYAWKAGVKYQIVVELYSNEKSPHYLRLSPYTFELGTKWKNIGDSPAGYIFYNPIIVGEYAFIPIDQQLWRFDPKMNTWKSFPVAKEIYLPKEEESVSGIYPSFMFASGDYIYLCSCQRSWDPDFEQGKTLSKMNIHTGAWTILADRPFRTSGAITPAVMGDDVYIATPEDSESLYKYNIRNNKWESIPCNLGYYHCDLFHYKNQLWGMNVYDLVTINLQNYQVTKMTEYAENHRRYPMIMGDNLYYGSYEYLFRQNMGTFKTEFLGGPIGGLDYYRSSFFALDGKIYVCNDGKMYQYIE